MKALLISIQATKCNVKAQIKLIQTKLLNTTAQWWHKVTDRIRSIAASNIVSVAYP